MQGPNFKRVKNKKRGNFEGPSSVSTGSVFAYPHRLNFYTLPPTVEITLDQFEQWAINRLRVLGEIESCLFRNKSPKETESILKPLLDKYMPLSPNSVIPASSASNPKAFNPLIEERRKDHYSHFILRLAFARSDDLRRRFTRAESILFRCRLMTDNAREKQQFVESLNLEWDIVSEEEKNSLSEQLMSASQLKSLDDESFVKVDWDRVTDLVEQRKVFLKGGKAYVPLSMQMSLLMTEFTARLEKGMDQTARALPRLDEDDRIAPILNHLSLGFEAPEYSSASSADSLNGSVITAAQIDSLTPHFPLCMRNLHSHLRRDKHLKHFGRLQFGLFIKGLGLTVEEAIIFWRTSFSKITDDQFNKEYRYNVRHSYGMEGNRRNYKPYSCQQILTEHPPGTGDVHGCPYRHFSMDNLAAAMSGLMNVDDRNVVSGVKLDVQAKKYHLACNRVFEHIHARELQREKEATGGILRETIIHPNDYFDRSYKLVHPNAGIGGSTQDGPGDVEMKG